MSQWPPPPDLASIAELVRAADPEGHLAEGAPTDEYEPEGEQLFSAIRHLSTAELIVANVLPRIETIWQSSFQLTPEQMTERRPALTALAQQIEHFFGPAAQPQTRSRAGA